MSFRQMYDRYVLKTKEGVMDEEGISVCAKHTFLLAYFDVYSLFSSLQSSLDIVIKQESFMHFRVLFF